MTVLSVISLMSGFGLETYSGKMSMFSILNVMCVMTVVSVIIESDLKRKKQAYIFWGLWVLSLDMFYIESAIRESEHMQRYECCECYDC